jgi:hypothetical protein
MGLTLLYIAHFIGDFVCQSAKIAKGKTNEFSKLIFHSILYAVTLGFFLVISIDFRFILLPLLCIAISHFIIDWARTSVERTATGHRVSIFIIDQVLHIVVISATYLVLCKDVEASDFLSLSIQTFGLKTVSNIITYSLLYLIMMQPSAIMIKNILFCISDDTGSVDNDSQQPSIKNAGYLIGILERIIITTLVLQSQMSTIGFVLAAKSLARFRQLEDQAFAEKYLVGTLLSLSIAIIVTLILKTEII